MTDVRKKDLICVFAGSARSGSHELQGLSVSLGRQIGLEGFDMIYGGGLQGMDEALTRNGRPLFLVNGGRDYMNDLISRFNKAAPGLVAAASRAGKFKIWTPGKSLRAVLP